MILRLLLIALLLSGCRTIQKMSSSRDSSSVKQEASKSKYTREIVTEYVTDTLWRTRLDTLYKTIPIPNYHIVEKPYIVRQTIRESGDSEINKTENTQIKQEEKEKSAAVPEKLQWAALIFVGALMLFGIALIIKQFK